MSEQKTTAPDLDPTGQAIATQAPLAERYDHVIVGGGMAAAKAVESIRELAPEASVAVVSADTAAPVYRPDLSKTLWADADAHVEDSILVTPDSEGTAPGERTAYRLGAEVTAIDPQAHTVTVDGRTVGYGSLLLATGAEPVAAGIPQGERVHTYRTVADYRRLKEASGPGTTAVVVGGGYIGTELAAGLTMAGTDVTLVVPHRPLLARMLPAELSAAVEATFQEKGVRIVEGRLASAAESGDAVTARLEDGTELRADLLVLALGVRPRTTLAEAAGLALADQGVRVDDRLRTSAPDVYAAGDIATFPDALLGERRVEHADAAETQGAAAGRNMVGADQAYTHTPFFWADLFDYGYEAIGELDTRHRTVVDLATGEDGRPDPSTAVVYYADEAGHVRGVLLWNVWDSVPQARALIERTAQEPVADLGSLKGRIPLG